METRTIPRETDDTAKGFFLQKLRALSMMLTYYAAQPPIDFIAAVEYGGDIYLENKRKSSRYVEENKNYDSKSFSFASHEIKNTLVYFLDYWLNNDKDTGIRFGFYATNKIAKEINKGTVLELGIILPDLPILAQLKDKNFADPNLISAVSTLLLAEYKSQYEHNKEFSLEISHYTEITNFKVEDWAKFFNSIEWQFEQEGIEDLERKIEKQIANIKIPGLDITGLEPFISAQLVYELEARHVKQVTKDRFIDKNYIELTFHRVKVSGIDSESYQYLSLDYKELTKKTRQQMLDFIQKKYSGITGRETIPLPLKRKVALFDPNLKFFVTQTEGQPFEKDKQIQRVFGEALSFDKPVFLFGELGSGKSTMVANYMLQFVDLNTDVIPIFIPSSYLHDKEIKDLESFINTVNRFINQEMLFPNGIFDLRTTFRTRKDILLIIDGIDELARLKAISLLTFLKTLKDNYSLMRIIVTGRPLEMEGMLPPGWHSYTTLPLNENDLKIIFLQEAQADGLVVIQDAQIEADKRLFLLNSKQELLAVTTTPLVACSIYHDLTPEVEGKTLGDILYRILSRRLDWYIKDRKEADFKEFLKIYPHQLQREKLLGVLAAAIFNAPSKSISELQLMSLFEKQIPQNSDKNIITNQALLYYQQAFLQKTTDTHFGFVSAPLLECAVGLQMASDLVGKIIHLDNFNNWRSLSFGLALVRARSETDAVRTEIEELLRKYMIWSNQYLPQSAILLAELKDAALASLFIDLLKNMQYRPIKLLGMKDQLSVYSIAVCMTMAGDKGFDWFWEEYINCRNPLIHYETKLAADIIGYYFLLNKFKLLPNQQQRINSIIGPNKTLQTSLCYELLPVFALIIETDFTPDERCRLLAGLLKDDAFGKIAETALRKIAETGECDVLTALEISCHQSMHSYTGEAALLWLELNKSRPMSLTILNSCIVSISKNNFEKIYSRLTALVNPDNLKAYLKYYVLSEHKPLAGNAALMLLWLGEKDVPLLNKALITSIDWLTDQYESVDEIILFIRSQGTDQAAIIAANMPLDNHLGVQPAYWRIFLDALIRSKDLYLPFFKLLVDNTSSHVLTRYPDIRLALNKLLATKPSYKDLLRDLRKGLLNSSAHNANAILVTCFPDREPDALVSLIKGFFNAPFDMEEWQSFLLGLNFSLEVLEKLHSQISNFIEGPRTFALLLLFYHRYHLTVTELEELYHDILGAGHFFDRPTARTTNFNPIVLSQSDFLPKLIFYLHSPDNIRANRAADILLNYHTDSMTMEQKAIAWSLEVEGFESYFYRLSLDHPFLLATPEFKKAADIFTLTRPHSTLLSSYLAADADPANWKSFIIQGIVYAEKSVSEEFYNLYFWILSFLRQNAEVKPYFIQAIKDLLLVPAYRESQSNNHTYQFLLLIAHELEVDVKIEIPKSLQVRQYRIDEELTCALFLRIQELPSGYPRSSMNSHMVLFAEYQPDLISEVPKEDLDRQLIESENISSELLPKIGQLLLYGQLDKSSLEIIAKQSRLGAILSTIIGFCRSESFPIETLLEISEIETVRNRTSPVINQYREIIQKIARSLLNDPENKNKYFTLVRSLLDQCDEFQFEGYLLELLRSGELPSLANIERLLSLLLDIPHILNNGLAFELCRFFADRMPEEMRATLIHNIELTLDSLNHHFENHSENKYNFVSWILSLASIHLRGSVTEIARHSFLIGLQGVFIDKNDLRYSVSGGNEQVIFAGTEMMNATFLLFEKLSSDTIQDILQFGLNVNVPEIRAVCRLLYYMSGKTQV